jgi:hypothetical protein
MITTKRTAIAAVLAAAAIAAPSASAMASDSHATVTVPAGVNAGLGPTNGVEASHVVATPIAQPSSSNGFDWGDAGIGAAGMLSLVGVGAVVFARRGRHGNPVSV